MTTAIKSTIGRGSAVTLPTCTYCQKDIAYLRTDDPLVKPSMTLPIGSCRMHKLAPEMLAVLEALVNSPNAKQNELWDRARSVIEKANGVPQ